MFKKKCLAGGDNCAIILEAEKSWRRTGAEMKKNFSVLMSLYERENPSYLAQALDSVLGQTMRPAEIVVVKDGPLTGALYETLARYQRNNPGLFRMVSLAENMGLGLALKAGLSKCSFELVARMDTDDVCCEDRFEKQLACMERHPDLALLGSFIREFSVSPDSPESVTVLPCSHSEILEFAKRRNPFRHMTVIFRKSAVLDSGGYRDFPYFEDYDLWVRMLQHGYRTANLPEYLVNVRANRAMFARRGGLKYLRQEIKFQKLLHWTGFISTAELIENILVRGAVRLLPNEVRELAYKFFLRQEPVS